MKPLIPVVLGLLALFGLWYYVRYEWTPKKAAKPALRAMMHDEDAPRAMEPSVGLQINEGSEATVFAGTPLWFTVGVNNTAAMDEAAAAPVRSKKRTGGAKQSAPASITIGDAVRPWTAAVEFVVPDGRGSAQKVPAPMPPLGTAAGPVELDTVRSAEASFGTLAAALAPGTYPVQACLSATGSWKGRTCSSPAKLTIVERPPQFSLEQELAVAQQTGRFGLLAGDPQALESAGRRTLAADSGSIPGHMYAGEAKYRQGKWAEALAEFTAARSQFVRRRPNAYERPRALDARISQTIEKIYKAEK
jgi:hypothetical protein